MSDLGPLADHAARLLTGTGLDPAEAVAVASGRVPAAGLAARALADGWRTAAAAAAADADTDGRGPGEGAP